MKYNFMAFPLIILGAGASFDSLDDSQYPALNVNSSELSIYRPPLTQSIFDLTRFKKYIDKDEITPSLAGFINARIGRMSFEEALTEVVDERLLLNKDRYKWLVAIRFYLAHIFNQISEKYYQNVNNYGYLINQIEDFCKGEGLIVNFNYDLLLEKNVSNICASTSINCYIKDPLKIIKIHGSCNWSYLAGSVIDPEGFAEAYKYFLNNAENIPLVPNDETQYLINPEGWTYRLEGKQIQSNLYLPAIAIPLTHKGDIFVCPKSHIDTFVKLLPSIDRILIIGWKAGDPYLLKTLKEHLQKPITTWIVNKKTTQEEMRKRYSDIPQLGISGVFNEGFNQFIKAGKLEDFLSF